MGKRVDSKSPPTNVVSTLGQGPRTRSRLRKTKSLGSVAAGGTPPPTKKHMKTAKNVNRDGTSSKACATPILGSGGRIDLADGATATSTGTRAERIADYTDKVMECLRGFATSMPEEGIGMQVDEIVRDLRQELEEALEDPACGDRVADEEDRRMLKVCHAFSVVKDKFQTYYKRVAEQKASMSEKISELETKLRLEKERGSALEQDLRLAETEMRQGNQEDGRNEAGDEMVDPDEARNEDVELELRETRKKLADTELELEESRGMADELSAEVERQKALAEEANSECAQEIDRHTRDMATLELLKTSLASHEKIIEELCRDKALAERLLGEERQRGLAANQRLKGEQKRQEELTAEVARITSQLVATKKELKGREVEEEKKTLLSRIFECVMCMETRSGDINSCAECSNIMCHKCSAKLNTCPSCRVCFKARPFVRNRAAEETVGALALAAGDDDGGSGGHGAGGGAA